MDISALFKLTYGLYVVGVKTEKGLGGCIVDAVGQVAAGDSPVVMMSCMKRNYTNESIKNANEFTLSVLPENCDPFVVGNFGFQSSRNVEKWVNVPHIIRDGLPLLKDSCAYLRCKVIDSRDFVSHTMFLCELADAAVGTSSAKPLVFGEYQLTMKTRTAEAFQKFKESGIPGSGAAVVEEKPKEKTKWRCTVCGYEYDGDTPFEELGDEWRCPVCNVEKKLFEKIS